MATGGGLLHDPDWIQIMADALARPVSVSGAPEASLRGAAVLALERDGADAAEAPVTAVEPGGRGVYNVVDDDPAPVAEWLPAMAQTLGAKKPMRVPRFVGRLFAGEAGVVMMTELRGASNAKTKRDLGWQPTHASRRQGFAAA